MTGTPSTLAYLAAARRNGALGHTGPNAGPCNCSICWRSPKHFIPTTENTENPT